MEDYDEEDTLNFGKIRVPAIYVPKERGEDNLSNYIRNFKYDPISDCKRLGIAEEFANILYEYVSHEPEILNRVDCLVPVPMTEAREMEKGFNHTRMILEKFSEKVEIEAEYDNLIKIRETESQTTLDRNQRRENVRDAFDVEHPNRFKGRRVLLIDDIATTCATIDECAKVLKTKARAQKVNALVLARNTQPQGDSNE